MSFVDAAITLSDIISRHPLYWQTPLSLIASVGGFTWFRHKVALQGRARIQVWITALSSVVVFIHMLIVGLPALSALGLIKVTAEQVVMYVGFMTLVYNLLKNKVIAWLTTAESEAPDSTTPSQINQTHQPSPAEAAGVATF